MEFLAGILYEVLNMMLRLFEYGEPGYPKDGT